MGLTCGMLSGYMLVDPNAEEEALLSVVIGVVLDADERIAETYVPGGQCISMQHLQDCIEVAKIRSRDVRKLLDQVMAT